MLSINTNIPSLIAQRSLNNSTKLLNQAIERMTTGFKINHASDNAANYSITTNMSTKLSSYQVAEDNVAMGLDLLSTAGGSLDLISDKLSRLRALAEQAANGTYGEQSLNAINAEAKSIIDETNRIYNTTEYNGQKLFGHSGKFMKDITVRDTSKMDSLEGVDPNNVITSGTYSISSAEELAKLATMANTGKIQGGEYVLANDIDLSAYTTGGGWTPIGLNNWTVNYFKGDFDGNGHVISNLYINRRNARQGLFGVAEGSIKNLGIENADITATGYFQVGALLGMTMNAGQVGVVNTKMEIENCYASDCSITGKDSVGGLVGESRSTEFSMKDCYTDVNIYSLGTYSGGLLANVKTYTECMNPKTVIENCFSTGEIQIDCAAAGGLIGALCGTSQINNCYSSVNITSSGECAGGFIGQAFDKSVITNCYATGNVNYLDKPELHNGYNGREWGGFIGCNYGIVININHCYATGNVNGDRFVGGLIGYDSSESNTITDSYSTGNITSARINETGGIIGYYSSTKGNLKIENTYALTQQSKLNGNIIGWRGGNTSKVNINNCGYSSQIEAQNKNDVGGGSSSNVEINNTGVYTGKIPFKLRVIEVNMQVGINGDDNSQISLETSFSLNGICDLYKLGLDDNDYMSKIDELINRAPTKQTEFGAAQNRLESALDEISTQTENLASSRSTLRDADIAKASSEYIRQQILQQASATLMATANQSPALALQLL